MDNRTPPSNPASLTGPREAGCTKTKGRRIFPSEEVLLNMSADHRAWI